MGHPNSRFKIQDPKIQDPEIKIENQDPESRSRIKIQKSKYRNQDPEIKIPKSRFRDEDPVIKIRNQDPKIF